MLKCFSRLEAMLLSRSFNQPEPVFQPVVVCPSKPPPAGAIDNQPFLSCPLRHPGGGSRHKTCGCSTA